MEKYQIYRETTLGRCNTFYRIKPPAARTLENAELRLLAIECVNKDLRINFRQKQLRTIKDSGNGSNGARIRYPLTPKEMEDFERCYRDYATNQGFRFQG